MQPRQRSPSRQIAQALAEAARTGLDDGLAWSGQLDDGLLVIVDQRALPGRTVRCASRDLDEICGWLAGDAVSDGAVAGAYALAAHLWPLAAAARAGARGSVLEAAVKRAAERLVAAAPASVALRHALERMRECLVRHMAHLTAQEMTARLLMEARRIQRDAEAALARTAELAARALPTGTVLVLGAAPVAAVIHAHRAGTQVQALVAEGRPSSIGARRWAPALARAGVPVRVCADAAVAALMAREQVQAVLAGAERIAANGDIAGPIGTYALAALALQHGIPVHVATPSSAGDARSATGARIVVPDRPADEVGAPGVAVVNPALDITPAAFVASIITERGAVERPDAERVRALLG